MPWARRLRSKLPSISSTFSSTMGSGTSTCARSATASRTRVRNSPSARRSAASSSCSRTAERSQVAGLYLLDVHVEQDRLAPERLLRVVRREGDAELLALAGLHPDEVLFEVGEELAAADLEHVVLGLAAL